VLFRSFQLVLETRRLFETAVQYYTKSDWRRGRYWKLSPRFSGTIIKIWRLKDNGVATLTFWGHVTIRLAVVDFLSVVHSDPASTWHRYGDMAV